MKIAIVHEWLTTFAGSEKALEQIVALFPEADIFCVVDFLPEQQRGFLKGHKVTTTFIQKLPLVQKYYRNYLPLMPLAIGRLDLADYDLVVSSNHAVANGVSTHPDQVHVSYTYSPMRYAWDLREQYLKESNLDRGVKGWLAKLTLSQLKKWDYRAAQGVDYFVGISDFIKDRIFRCYGKDAAVIYPPVDTDFYQIGGDKGDYYLVASRMVPYKMMPLIVSAFAEMPERKLVVIGDGPDLERVKKCASNNTEILGYQNDSILRAHLQTTKALVFAAEEDFGILPVEAQACGTPVVGFGKGGLLETVNGIESDKPTGVFFGEQSKQSIKRAIEVFEEHFDVFTRENCRLNALRFSGGAFRTQFKKYIDGVIDG